MWLIRWLISQQNSIVNTFSVIYNSNETLNLFYFILLYSILIILIFFFFLFLFYFLKWYYKYCYHICSVDFLSLTLLLLNNRLFVVTMYCTFFCLLKYWAMWTLPTVQFNWKYFERWQMFYISVRCEDFPFVLTWKTHATIDSLSMHASLCVSFCLSLYRSKTQRRNRQQSKTDGLKWVENTFDFLSFNRSRLWYAHWTYVKLLDIVHGKPFLLCTHCHGNKWRIELHWAIALLTSRGNDCEYKQYDYKSECSWISFKY